MKPADSPKLLVFLGNTGNRYSRTRHNVGWRLAHAMLGETTGDWQRKFKALWAHARIGGIRVTALLPQTMMNLSGEAVQAASRFFRFSASEVMVVHDDTELGFGQIAVRFGGGLAGHNGLKSVTHCLGTRDFWRLRIGVGRPARGDLHAHVLGRFREDEEAVLDDILRAAESALEVGFSSGFDPAGSPVEIIAR